VLAAVELAAVLELTALVPVVPVVEFVDVVPGAGVNALSSSDCSAEDEIPDRDIANSLEGRLSANHPASLSALPARHFSGIRKFS
jgi:hypothetical protein